MGIRKAVAQAASAVSTVALKYVFRRPAANFPGKAALVLDPDIIAELAPKLSRGSICVVGTNGKTTVTNMVADILQAQGMEVVCNRTGANLDSGVATSLLHAGQSDWGVFECDEMWLAKILPYLQSRFVVLLNLFRDQLDRMGDTDRIQDSIIAALASSPETTVLYNADDPFCERIVRAVPNPSVPFGIGEDIGTAADDASDARMCQLCDGMLHYDYRTYNQLGRFACTQCDFRRAPLRFSARRVSVSEQEMDFDVVAAVDEHAVGGGAIAHMNAPYGGVYMVYNLLAVYAAAHLAGASDDAIMGTVRAYDHQNGRLQRLTVAGRPVLINLAKNPTGFNQNIALMRKNPEPKAVAFFVNDNEGDGRDVSWLWDINFEQLAAERDLVVYAGGMRRNDLQLRLKYAGVDAQLVDDAVDCMARISTLPDGYHVYMIANYTSLPDVQADLERLARGEGSVAAPPLRTHECFCPPQDARSPLGDDGALHIVHLYPDLLNLYGDAGNVRVLQQRSAWRGIAVDVRTVEVGADANLGDADIVFVGSGPEREQQVASGQLCALREQLAAYIEDGGVVLAVGGGFQVLGSSWPRSDGTAIEGAGVLDVVTHAAESGARAIGDAVLTSPLFDGYALGYENHAGRTELGAGVQPFATAVDGHGKGNNAGDGSDGARVGNVVATYSHGPVLGKSPELADWLIAKAVERKVGSPVDLVDLDDSIEHAARSFMLERLGVRS